MTVVDMTMGNGNDTFFLCKNAGYVYAFDIQRDALKNTENRLNGLENYSLILANHLFFDDYVDPDESSLFVFNLGFLPGGNKEIITEAENTLESFAKAYDFLTKDGLICITFYFHEGGFDEYYRIEKYISDNRLCVLDTYREDKPSSPKLMIIKK